MKDKLEIIKSTPVSVNLSDIHIGDTTRVEIPMPWEVPNCALLVTKTKDGISIVEERFIWAES